MLEEQKNGRVAVLCENGVAEAFADIDAKILALGSTEEEMATRLYDLLREAEKVCDTLIAIEPKKKDGVMVGVLNRLKKACQSVDIAH